MIPRAIQQVFSEIDNRPEHAISIRCVVATIFTNLPLLSSVLRTKQHFSFIRISYLEIYNEVMFDLLSTLPETMAQVQQNPLQVVEDRNGVFVKGLSCHLAQNEEEALNLLFEV